MNAATGTKTTGRIPNAAVVSQIVEAMTNAGDFPFDAEGGACLVRETARAIDALNLSPSTRAAIHHDNLMKLLTPSELRIV